ncbi:MAG: thioredoxin domain-containing protein [Sideroxyarcus sp.]|nr:thioredoxin domain-containing protein [Sideroxyarcus sp.]
MSDYSCNVEEDTFDELVVTRSRELPVLVDISAEWCAPCRVLAPLLHKMVFEYDGKFILGIVDADENMKIAGRHKVRGFPTVVAYSRGIEVGRFHGAQTEGFLRNFIDKVIERHAAVPPARGGDIAASPAASQIA